MKYKLLILFIYSFSILPSFGTVNPADQNMINEQQKQLLEQAQQQRDSLKQSYNIKPEIINKPSEQAILCFTIQKIEFKGADHLPIKAQKQLTSQYLNQCLSLEKIQFIVKSVTNYYIGKGFVTSSAYLEEQDISSGTLIISVVEGKVDEIYLDGGSPTLLMMALPNIKGNVLNLRDIEQGLEQLNRLKSKQITISIQPSSQDGYSTIILTNQTPRATPLFLGFGINNGGQKSTGVAQGDIHLSIENPLQLADVWRFSFASNSNFRQNKANRSFTGQISLPYGYWTFDYLYSNNFFYYDIPLVFNQWRYKGKNQLQRFTSNRLLHRDSETKLTLNANFTNKNNQSSIAKQQLTISSPTLNIAAVGLDYSTVFKQGYVTFNPSLSQGLHLFNSTSDKQVTDGMPKSQFTKLSISSSYYKPLTESVNYLTSVYGQWSKQNLYSTERISIGGEYSVRGFKEDSLSGNKGFYWRNELTHQTRFNGTIRSLSVTAAIDTGWIKSQKSQVDGGNMTGIALGVALSDNHYYNTSLTIGKPLFYPEIINPDRWVSYLQLSLNF
ncbi:ShlB/FhaC/HecB family hemolysin secretion/activation protein [Orbus wheelerorum]|uniref:ShlB/FhaC/HecB family hemolysin secretion/activation protein n=1 Tax=Orbus wheelerorum TaxID=3074111 RepID=UPI00370D9BC0